MMTYSIIRVILALITAYTWIIVIYCILTWIPFQSRIMQDIQTVLSKLVDPFLNLFRKFIPPIGGMVDVTPIVAILVLQLVRALIIGLF